MPASASAQEGSVALLKASPTWVQLTRSDERAIGMRCGVPSPSLSGSEVPYAYQYPSLARISDGSANVSANVRDTGLV
jgi:hypothetical protein